MLGRPGMAEDPDNGGTQPITHEIHATDEVVTSDSAGIVLTSVHRHLLDPAAEHIQADRFRESIVIAQAAAEACAARAIDALLAPHPAPLREALEANFGPDSTYNLKGKWPQKVWTFLAFGDVITAQAFWSRYDAHTQRRNRVAHGRPEAFGYAKADADESLKTATEFVDHIEQVTGGIRGANAW
jgi:hypothetical protein